MQYENVKVHLLNFKMRKKDSFIKTISQFQVDGMNQHFFIRAYVRRVFMNTILLLLSFQDLEYSRKNEIFGKRFFLSGNSGILATFFGGDLKKGFFPFLLLTLPCLKKVLFYYFFASFKAVLIGLAGAYFIRKLGFTFKKWF